MGILSISTFNSVVYYALNFTQVINAVLMLAAIPPMIIIFSSIMKIEKQTYFKYLDYSYQLLELGQLFQMQTSKNNFFKFQPGRYMDDSLCFELVVILDFTKKK